MAAASIRRVIPCFYLDCLVVRSRDSGAVQKKSVYLGTGK